MKFFMLVCAGSDFTPPETIGPDTEAWVTRADREATRTAGGRLRATEDAVLVGARNGEVTVTSGPRIAADEPIVGFDVIDCPDIDTDNRLITTHPMARAGRIELREIWDGTPLPASGPPPAEPAVQRPVRGAGGHRGPDTPSWRTPFRQPNEKPEDSTMARPVVHFEIIGKDPAALRDYFGALFDWEFDTPSPVAAEVSDLESYGFHDLVTTEDGSGIRGGIGGGPAREPRTVFYVGVDDVEAALTRAEELGGTRRMGPATSPNGLVVGHFTDPEGNLIGVAGVS